MTDSHSVLRAILRAWATRLKTSGTPVPDALRQNLIKEMQSLADSLDPDYSAPPTCAVCGASGPLLESPYCDAQCAIDAENDSAEDEDH